MDCGNLLVHFRDVQDTAGASAVETRGAYHRAKGTREGAPHDRATRPEKRSEFHFRW
jgi:hypothetical protein